MKTRWKSGSRGTKENGAKLNRRTFLKLSVLTGAAIGANQIIGESGTGTALTPQEPPRLSLKKDGSQLPV